MEKQTAQRKSNKSGRTNFFIVTMAMVFFLPFGYTQTNLSFPVVDTDQTVFYDTIMEMDEPAQGEAFYGQDANYDGYQPSYQDNGDGTVSDLVTGLMWQQNLLPEKLVYADALAGADTFSLAGYTDWRLPTIKELYSLILFSGLDISGLDPQNLAPFIDTNYFEFKYGDESAGERLIDAQYWSSTEYLGTTMNGDATTFGVNFADGRIKGYPSEAVGPPWSQFYMTSFVKYVRGNPDYGINDFEDQDDGTIADNATGLVWDKNDSGEGLSWEDALAWVQQKNAENYLGYNNWRLPNAKELQSILDYTRSPQTSGSAAIDPVFNISQIIDEGGGVNYPFFWTGTTHANSEGGGNFGVYLCFGEALGWMEMPPNSGNYSLLDVHGAGAQRSDPKSGDPNEWPNGNGPQGDVVRIYNYVRLVRNIETTTGATQTIQLLDGWSGISSFIDPENPMVADIFSELVDQENLVILQNLEDVFWPEAGLNTIDLNGGWNNQSGYIVKTIGDQQIVFEGTIPENMSISYDEPGWYILPVLSECNVNTETLFEDEMEHLVVLKEVAGTEVFWPGVVQTLITMEPGRAYLARFNGPVSITFPACE